MGCRGACAGYLLALSNSSLKEPNILPMRPRPLPTMRAASVLAWAAFFLAAAFWPSVSFLTLGLAAASALGAASAVRAAGVRPDRGRARAGGPNALG